MLSLSKPCVSFLYFQEEIIHTPTFTALHIEAEVVRWVYTVGSEKPSASETDTLKMVKRLASGFFSPLSNMFEASSMPHRTQTPVVAPKESIDLPFEGRFVERCLEYFRCKCRCTAQQENDSRAATFHLEETSQPTALLVDICELHCSIMWPQH
jgi:hypothetical protein